MHIMTPQLTKLDVNQITKTVYDPTTGALSTVPAYVDGTPMPVSTPIYMAPYRLIGVMVDWTNVSGELHFEGSIDGKLFKQIGQSFPISDTGSQDFKLENEPYCYIKLESTVPVNAVYMLRA